MWPMESRPRVWRTHGLLGLAAALVCLAGCGDFGSRGVVARADDWTLTEDRLAELLVLAQPFPLDSAAAYQLAIHWVGGAALSLRSAAGDSLLGSEAVAASTWLNRREAILSVDLEARLGAGVTLGLTAVEGVFRAGSLRLIAHVLRRAGPETSSSERLRQQRTAERLVNTLVEGGSWDQIVAESEDAASRQAGGLLGLVGRGELPSTLDRTAFGLEPGQVSGITQSSQGFHILYRPRFEEVGSLYASRLRQRRLTEADAAAAEKVRAARGIATSPGGPAVLRRMAEAPGDWLESQQPLATWDDGSLTAGVVARYLFFLPPGSLSELALGGEEARRDLLGDLATRELRIADAAARGLSADPSVAEAYALSHADEMEYWTLVLELDGAEAPSRSALARHMELVVSRQEEARSLPPLLEALLLGRVDTRVRERGVLAAIVLARGMLREAGGTGGAGP